MLTFCMLPSLNAFPFIVFLPWHSQIMRARWVYDRTLFSFSHNTLSLLITPNMDTYGVAIVFAMEFVTIIVVTPIHNKGDILPSVIALGPSLIQISTHLHQQTRSTRSHCHHYSSFTNPPRPSNSCMPNVTQFPPP